MVTVVHFHFRCCLSLDQSTPNLNQKSTVPTRNHSVRKSSIKDKNWWIWCRKMLAVMSHSVAFWMQGFQKYIFCVFHRCCRFLNLVKKSWQFKNALSIYLDKSCTFKKNTFPIRGNEPPLSEHAWGGSWEQCFSLLDLEQLSEMGA